MGENCHLAPDDKEISESKKGCVTDEQIADLAAFVEVLKEIRTRLLSEGVDLDYFEKRFGIKPHEEN